MSSAVRCRRSLTTSSVCRSPARARSSAAFISIVIWPTVAGSDTLTAPAVQKRRPHDGEARKPTSGIGARQIFSILRQDLRRSPSLEPSPAPSRGPPWTVSASIGTRGSTNGTRPPRSDTDDDHQLTTASAAADVSRSANGQARLRSARCECDPAARLLQDRRGAFAAADEPARTRPRRPSARGLSRGARGAPAAR